MLIFNPTKHHYVRQAKFRPQRSSLRPTSFAVMATVKIVSQEIARAELRISTPLWTHLYAIPFLCFYPLLAYAYYVKYDEWLKSEEWTFLACVSLGVGHGLSFLVTRWSAAARAWITTRKARGVDDADCVRIVPLQNHGQGEIVSLHKPNPQDPSTFTFVYQQDTYTVYFTDPLTLGPLPYPSSSHPPLGTYHTPKGLTSQEIDALLKKYGKNEFNIPVPSFSALFGEHATAPFFVFQVFCVTLWMLDEYWYYSLFTLFMLVMFECTVVWQRLRTLNEFRTMSVTPYQIQVKRDDKWKQISSNELLPGDVVSVVRTQSAETVIPADILLVQGTCIVNEAMLSGESTPLLKESITLLEASEQLDADSTHRNEVLFSGTKILQATAGGDTPDGGCLGVVLRTSFGTAQGQLVRTMIFATERVTANNLESFLFIGFLLIFALAASWYVWTKGIERDLKKSKLLLDCILIVTSVVPPELPMELSLAVNASLVALSKFAIFCTEPFRIPFAGRVDICCFDKTGTITAENLVLEGVAGVDSLDQLKLVHVKESPRTTTLALAGAHALVRLDDGTVVGDPMEKTTLEALEWAISKGDLVAPAAKALHATQVQIRRRFQFSSALKRMSTVSTLPGGKGLVAVKGAPETIKGMLAIIPQGYDETFKWFTRRGSRVLALGMKEFDSISVDKINKLHRNQVECELTFAGFLVFHSPLKPDAQQCLRELRDASHRCIMITGDNPLTAVHVANDVDIMDRDALILDLKEKPAHEGDLEWRTVDESKVIPVNPDEPLDQNLLDTYDICMTGAALKQYASRPAAWHVLAQHTWVYARVSPAQKEFIVRTLRELGYTTLMAGDGTNDVGALKQAHVGVALLDGTEEDLKKIAEHDRLERLKKVYQSQLSISARFNQPPPPPPPAIAHMFPDVVEAQKKAVQEQAQARRRNPMEKFDMASITDALANMEGEDEVPKIKLGDASCAAPFTSKLSNVKAIVHIIRQGRTTLVATIQMYKILALNCLITAYSLSVQYLDGIKFGDYQVTITGMLMSVCFLCISRAKPIEKLSRERPLSNIFNFYVLLSVLLQFALHIISMVYITELAHDLEAKYEPNLLNTAVFLLGLSQQVSTFALNYQGRPFRESIRENPALYWGLVGASAVAFSGATDFMPELNRWLQVVEMSTDFKIRLTTAMIVDFGGCYIVEKVCKHLFADLEPKEIITRGRERRDIRRLEEERARKAAEAAVEAEKKTQ
ncbi:endoplasmic reticulum Ca-transporting P-type ATPase [Vararia minispora EC-137]|uniref:Endoplasmic reticulum Ca-transporting P-type ATPase n=1 Tax=Vararia minispora EC-137 TaxID=1314806 RepID=A0ACB8QD24_9AGAM|nr:endoplasmic reticulum Ca-transporting P-type ATPase [Vararia minispora EC-137]